MASDRILIYGGAFDPPHKGHMAALKAAAIYSCPDKIYVVPSYVSPGGQKKEINPFYVRMEMCRCFREISADVTVSGLEKTKRRRRSFTLSTIKKIRRRFPDSKLFLLIGSDKLRSLYHWKGIVRILSMCEILVVSRPGVSKKEEMSGLERVMKLGGKIVFLDAEMPEISSDDYRNGSKENSSLPDSVVQYIKKNDLYGGADK